MKGRKITGDGATVAVASATVPQLVVTVRGGESVTLTSNAASTNYHKLNFDRALCAVKGYYLYGSGTVSIDLTGGFKATDYLEIWATASNATDTISYLLMSGPTVEGA